MAEKKINYTDNDRAIVNALKDAENGLTIAEIREITGLNLQPGTFTSCVRKGLIKTADEKREVITIGKRPATVYRFITSDFLSGEKGAYNYSDNEKKLLSVISTMEGDFMLCELAEAMGLEKLSSGAVGGLVRKGNVVKVGKVQREVPKSNKVNVYLFNADIPE